MSVAVTDIELTEKFAIAFAKKESLQTESRKNAMDAFRTLGLPGNKTEEYRFAPITRALSKNFDFETNAVEGNIDSIESWLVAGIDANVVVFVNGVYSEKLSRVEPASSTFKITHLSAALESGEALPYFEKFLNTKSDPFSALNTALWQDGVFVHVADNTRIERPLAILHINDARQSQNISHTRLLTVLGKNSELTLVERTVSLGANNIFHTFAEEIAVDEGATFDYIKIQNDEGKLHQVANTMIHQSANAKVNTFTLTVGGAFIRNNFNITIDGEHCESHFHGLYLLRGNTLADNHTVVDHLKPNSYSNEMYKGVMDENSKGVFNGKIFVRPHAQKTNAFQSNRNILLTDTATVNTKPQLEIWADDVKCSHGCTSGQLDEEALFYLRSRGISLAEAKAMLLYAFTAETFDLVKNPAIKTYIDGIVSAQLNQLHQ